MKSFIFRIDDMRVVRRETTGFRFYLRTEDLELEFDFVDFILSQKCIEVGEREG